MPYFRELPDISHASLLPKRSRNDERLIIKNIFRRAIMREDIFNSVTTFDYYNIQENMRPDTVARVIYDDPDLDWVVLITNNITNVRDQWPLSNNDLHEMMLDKYGSYEALENVHHYETTAILDEDNRTVLPEGLEVDKDFQYSYYGTNSTITTNPVVPVTNYQYESKRNDEKRKIVLLKPTMVGVFISDMKNMMKYKKTSSYINRNLKESYNPRISGV